MSVTEQPASWASQVEVDHERACMDITTAALEALRTWVNGYLDTTTTQVTWTVGVGPSLTVTWGSTWRERRRVERSNHLQLAIQEVKIAIILANPKAAT